ncbi:inositol polyphosphate kinase, putative [Bodo saltans]|uniref:Kinase n=1 Tax=Bodo saltans TaxID=75058 RepID=A0A0S4JHF3_BODSA|nr:inositol polyphosphate kinase, putative [Bodo saltans]|eukprot:CUG89584.1 inositol polyphosphate kinase, putative [Bodo saltans]
MSQQPPVHEAQLVLVSGHPEDFASGPLYQLITDPKDSRGVCLPTIVKRATLRETLFYLAMHGLRSWTSGTMSHDDLLGGEGTAGGAFLAELRRFAPRLIDVSISTELTKQLSDDDDRQQCNSVVFAINGVPKLLSCGVDSSQILAQWEHQVLEVVEEHSRLERRKEIRKYLAQLQPTQTWRDALTEDNASQQLLREVEDAAATELVEQAPPPSSPPASLLCHVRLENLIGNMTLPCVLDIKVGRVRFHPCTPRKKRDKITFEEVHRQESTVQQFGLRICGAQHYHADRESSEGAFVLCNCVEKKFGHPRL